MELPLADASDTLLRVLDRLRAEGVDADGPAARADLERVFTRAEPFVRSLCRDQLRRWPAEAIEEVVQDVMVVAWRKLPGWRGEGRFEGWLFGITTRVCANARRKRRDLLTDDGELEAVGPTLSALAALRRDERERVLLEALDGLEETEQRVVWLRLVEELGRDEIALEAGLADANAVRVVFQRACRRLERALSDRLQELGHGPSLLRDSGA